MEKLKVHFTIEKPPKICKPTEHALSLITKCYSKADWIARSRGDEGTRRAFDELLDDPSVRIEKCGPGLLTYVRLSELGTEDTGNRYPEHVSRGNVNHDSPVSRGNVNLEVSEPMPADESPRAHQEICGATNRSSNRSIIETEGSGSDEEASEHQLIFPIEHHEGEEDDGLS